MPLLLRKQEAGNIQNNSISQKCRVRFPNAPLKGCRWGKVKNGLFWIGIGVEYFYGFKSQPGGAKWLFLWNP
jgi:hypothetical protein